MQSVAVAYSGGRDSTALLHATLAVASVHDWRVVAIHVHHGLQRAADAWLAHCEDQCRQWARDGRPVVFVASQLTGQPAVGESVECWARDGRYAALGRIARAEGADVVLLGHHRRDQAETVVLQALRGAGLAGVSAMPERVVRDGVAWLRPWLRRSGREIADYVRRHGLAHIDDDSNADPRFARNRLRHAVWPALEAAFPEAEASLARSARWAQEADAALAELAAIDLAAIVVDGAIDVAAWSTLSASRRSLALRSWLRAVTGRSAAASLVGRLLDEVSRSDGGTWRVRGGALRAYRGRLRFDGGAERPRAPDVEHELCIDTPGLYPLPRWCGSLSVEPAPSGGVPLASLAHVDLRQRTGGERFQAGPGRPLRSLKKQFQSAGVPAWERDGPLVYRGDRLVYVPGLGLDARVVTSSSGTTVRLQWLPARGAP